MSKEYLDYTLANIANRHAEENNTELNEVYNNNRMKNTKKIKIFKNKLQINKKNINKRILVATIISGIGLVAISHMRAENIIYQQVKESGIIPEGISIRDDSQYGHIISYENEYGNRQEIEADDLRIKIIENGLKENYTIDEIAIAIDAAGISSANLVEGSSLLGRIGTELIALSNEKNISEGRTK